MTRKIDKEVMNEIKLYQSQDYDICDETSEYFKLKKNKSTFGGHLLVFIFFGWWTFFIANIIYHFASIKTKKVMK